MNAAVLYTHDDQHEEKVLLGAVEKERVIIGSSDKVDISLDEIRCDAIHALIEKTENEYRLVDLGSHFGTYKDNVVVTETSLQIGDSFQIGANIIELAPLKDKAHLEKQAQRKRQQNQIKSAEELNEEPLLTQKRLLQVTQFWGDAPLDVRTFGTGSKITVGSQRDVVFPFSLSDPRFQNAPLELCHYTKGELKLHIPVEATGLVWIGNEVYSLDKLRHKNTDSQQFGDLAVTLRVGDRAYLQFGEMALQFEFVSPSQKSRVPFWKRLDRQRLKLTGSVLGAWLLLFVILGLSTGEKEKTKTLEDVPEHLKKAVYDAGVKEALKQQKAAIGKVAQNLEGGRARGEEGKSSAQKTPKKQQVKKQKKETKSKKNTKDTKTKAVNLDRAFSSSSSSKQVDAPANAVKGAKTAGNTASALSDGGFASGTQGQGAGGGGQSVGIGELKGSSTGGGKGAGDYGLNPSKGSEIKVPPKKEIVTLGGLDPEVISKIIQRYLPQIQHCYEQELVSKPDLKGKVLASFVINKDGRVDGAKVVESSLADPPTEECIIKKISKWKFPEPKGDGSVGVKYPFLLMSNASQ